METKNSYVNFQKALYAEKYGHPQEAENWWKVCAHDCPGQLLTQAVDIAVRNRFLLNPLIERITIEEWDRCVQTLVEHIPQTDMDSFFKDIFPLLKDYPLCASKIRQYFLEKQLSRNALEHTELVKLLGRYCEGLTTAAKKIYRDEVLSGSEAYILPSQYRFAFLIDKVLSLIEDGQFTGCIPLLKEAFHISPGMTIVVGQLTQHLTEQIEKPPKVVSEEFAALGKQVKGVLSGLMEKGQWEEAYGVTAQLIPLLPDDLEVLRMKQIILSSQQFLCLHYDFRGIVIGHSILNALYASFILRTGSVVMNSLSYMTTCCSCRFINMDSVVNDVFSNLTDIIFNTTEAINVIRRWPRKVASFSTLSGSIFPSCLQSSNIFST